MKKNKVFDHLRYLEKRTFKGHALFIPMVELTSDVTKRVLELLMLFEQEKGCHVFILSNGDGVAFFSINKLQDMMFLSLKLKELDKQYFFKYKLIFYNLVQDLSVLTHKIKQIEKKDLDISFKDLKILQKIPTKELNISDLKGVLNELEKADISHLVRHQPICQVSDIKMIVPVFTSIFCRNTDVRQALFPKITLNVDEYLKREFRYALNKKIIYKELPKSWGSVFTVTPYLMCQSDFKELLRKHKDKSIILEIGEDDFFNEIELFLKARAEDSIYEQVKIILRLKTFRKEINYFKIPIDYLKITAEMIDDFLNYSKDKVIIRDVSSENELENLVQKGFCFMQGPVLTKLINQ